MNEQMRNFIDYEEDKHWWFVARTQILKAIVVEYSNQRENLLDVGCGTGYFMSKISSVVKNVEGVDPHTYQTQKFGNIFKGEAENLPFDEESFDVVTCLDVLEHVQNPQLVIKSIYKVLKPGGLAVITVPANQWMYGPHDRENGHVKRYSLKELREIIPTNFDVIKASYFNTLLFPIEAVIRVIERIMGKRITKEKAPANLVNSILKKIFESEKHWLLMHKFPLGVSCLVVLRKELR